MTPDGRWLLLGSGPDWAEKQGPDASLEIWEIATRTRVALLQHDDV